jgi:hypothetical protein
MEIIGEPVQFIIDEGKNDYHTSVQQEIVTFEGRTARLDDFLRERYGDDKFHREMRGILGQRKFAEWVITGQLNTPITDVQYCDWLIQNDQWWEDEYPPNCLATMNYTMNPAWRYPTAEDGNFGHDATELAPILLPKKASIKPRNATPIPEPEEEPPVIEPPPDNPILYRATVSGNGVHVNIRESRSVTSNILGRIPAAPGSLTLMVADADNIDFNGYVWRRVQILQGDTLVNAYVADKYVTVIKLPDDPLFYDLQFRV